VSAAAFLRGRHRLHAQSRREYSTRAIDLVNSTTVVDLLSQLPFPNGALKVQKLESWLKDSRLFTPEDQAVYRQSGVRAFAIGAGARDYNAGLQNFARWNGLIAARGDVFIRISGTADFQRVRAENKTGILLSLQDSSHFRAPDDVDEFYSLGQRISQLTYNLNNKIASGFLEYRDGGLSAFGRSIMQRMEKTGMAVDASHCGDQTTLDALDAATRPLIFTHASCRAVITGHLRAKTDEMIRKLARTGGVMGIPFIRFLIRAEEPVGIAHVLDHFDHVRKLVGVEFLAVGSDLDVLGLGQPAGFEAASQSSASSQPNFERYAYHVAKTDYVGVDGLDHGRRIYDLTEGLISRGYSDADIALILGGNAIRVLGSIWK
jgi:membrane dipeptidase